MDPKQIVIFDRYLTIAKQKFLGKLTERIMPSGKLENFVISNKLGQGTYGMVVAAETILPRKEFAIKVVKKKKLIREKDLKHLVTEIRILNAIKFNFAISLDSYFTDKCNVYMVMPKVAGGHFFRFLRTVKRFEENCARFFAGQVVLTIEYLHYMGITYRDLKPENLLLDTDGYLKLVDFGFAKKIDNGFTYTFCGTPEYISPEILLSKGYSKSTDWWSFGILLYEMCCGRPPFTSPNTLKLYEKIIIGKIHWPDYFSSSLKNILQGLLEVNKTKRLGCMKNEVKDIKAHQWFINLDWIALWNKEMRPPIRYTVPVQSVTDDEPKREHSFLTQNCDQTNLKYIDSGI